MKKSFFAVLSMLIIGSSCTKTPSGTSSGSGYTCTCNFIVLTHDTTVYFQYYGVSADTASARCAYEDSWAKSIAGKNGGGCHL